MNVHTQSVGGSLTSASEHLSKSASELFRMVKSEAAVDLQMFTID